MTVQDVAAKVTDGDQLDDGYFNDTSGIRAVECGETLAAGDLVFVYMSGHANEGEAWLSDANVQDKNRVNGIVVIGGNDGDTGYIQTQNVYTTTGLTAKETYYLSATVGELTTTPSGVRVGQAISTTQLFIDIIQDDRDTLSTIKSYLPNHANMIANPLTAFWKLCDGTAINDAESPLNGGNAPDINDNRKLAGDATSDDGTNNTAAGATTHGNHGPAFNEGAGGGKTEGFNVVNHEDPHISVVFIFKIK